MKVLNLKTVGIAIALVAATSAANAGFVPVDGGGTPQSTIPIVGNNDFRTTLAGIGVTSYPLGASLGVNEAGSVTYYYYGKEAGYLNVFNAGALSYSSGFTPTSQSSFPNGILIGSVAAASNSLLDFNFCAYSAPNVQVGKCISNAANDGLGLGSFQSIAFSVAGNVAWLFWDDSGAGPDDNHDDMLIKAVFTPRSVPEPATLGLFGLGLLGAWVAGRRRIRKA